ncbi:HD domain-containing phosphohydrolase [Azotobacter salinestris]|uniref:HD domain-containing phosphohydrolase n=1 Tax=Azotobacter salinestris TaxID=69964 RepID=UPI0032DF8806
MEQACDTYSRIDHADKCRDLLEQLCEQGGARLIGLSPETPSLAAVLMEVVPGERLVLDLTSVPAVAPLLEVGGHVCRLAGRVASTLLRSAPLGNWRRLPVPGRIQLACAWPEWLEILHRRSTFRAELPMRLTVPVEVLPAESERPLVGRLLDLSQGGCQIELPASSASGLQAGQALERIALCFPNGQQIELRGQIRHRQLNADWKAARFGCAFDRPAADLERRLWFYVREIERESARGALGGDSERAPSPLFQAARATQAADLLRTHGLDYATPMARRLAQVSLYLSGLLVDLQQGNDIEPARLSWHCDYLLGLLDEDRQDLLFAVHCLVDDPPLVKHGIAVAVRLADLARSRGLPNDLVKAICACALVHDLGKALLPPELLRSESLDREQREILGRHVTLLRERLGQCKWLAEPVILGVVEQINERLDGSGYPHGLRSDQLGELARMAAVVDVIDAMGRPRPDRPEQAISSVYRRLIGCEAQLDRRWCQHYIQHFGLIPVGSLVRFAEGDLAWVERLDRKGEIAQVRLADQSGMRGATLSAPLSGDELAALGPIEGIVIPGS